MKLQAIALVGWCLLVLSIESCNGSTNAHWHEEEQHSICHANIFYSPQFYGNQSTYNSFQIVSTNVITETYWLESFAQQFNKSESLELIHYMLPGLIQPTSWNELSMRFQHCVVATYAALLEWCHLFRLIFLPVLVVLLLLMEAVMPHTKAAAFAIFATFRTLDPNVQVGFVILTGLFLFAWYKGFFNRAFLAWKRLKAQCRRFVRSMREHVATKSKTAAYLLPHAIYCILCYFVLTWSPTVVADVLSHSLMHTWLVTVLPLFQSIGAIKTKRHHNTESTEYFERCLKYWILWSYFTTAMSFLSVFVPGFVLRFVHPDPLYVTLFLNWLHAMKGYQVLYKVLTSSMQPYLINGIQVNEIDNSNFVLRSLATFGVVSTRTATILRDVCSQGPALGALFFLVTPGFLTNVGCYLFGLAFPAYLIMGTLRNGQRRTHEWWVCYYCVVSLFEYWFQSVSNIVTWIPLVYHVKLICVLWLQFPYFRGAQRLFDAFFNNIFIDPNRRILNTQPAT